jgi:hypothetical protein
MNRLIIASGNNVRNAVAAAKQLLYGSVTSRAYRAARTDSVNRSAEGEGLYRVILSTGDVVEVSVIQHAKCSAQELISRTG